MIYVLPSEKKPIRQGDIFTDIPRVSVALSEMPMVIEEDARIIPWATIANEGKTVKAILPVTPVYAIVATQDCDTVTSVEITLCEIQPFVEVEGKAKEMKLPKKWQSIITQHARINQKWFYLPPDPRIGFTEKMGVDFRRTIRVPRMDLEDFKTHRKGSLNPLAKQHFRERIGQFFRRYAYNEWYSLEAEELEAYEKNRHCKVEPRYPWQIGK